MILSQEISHHVRLTPAEIRQAATEIEAMTADGIEWTAYPFFNLLTDAICQIAGSPELPVLPEAAVTEEDDD